jgi:hypothetical protein
MSMNPFYSKNQPRSLGRANNNTGQGDAANHGRGQWSQADARPAYMTSVRPPPATTPTIPRQSESTPTSQPIETFREELDDNGASTGNDWNATANAALNRFPVNTTPVIARPIQTPTEYIPDPKGWNHGGSRSRPSATPAPRATIVRALPPASVPASSAVTQPPLDTAKKDRKLDLNTPLPTNLWTTTQTYTDVRKDRKLDLNTPLPTNLWTTTQTYTDIRGQPNALDATGAPAKAVSTVPRATVPAPKTAPKAAPKANLLQNQVSISAGAFVPAVEDNGSSTGNDWDKTAAAYDDWGITPTPAQRNHLQRPSNPPSKPASTAPPSAPMKRPTAAAEIAAPTATLSKAAQDSNAALVIFYFFSRVLSVKIA